MQSYPDVGLRREHLVRVVAAVLLTLAATTPAWSDTGAYALRTPYVWLGGHGGAIASLRFDATGRGRWGAETLALRGLRLVRVGPDGVRTSLADQAASWESARNGAELVIAGLAGRGAAALGGPWTRTADQARPVTRDGL